MSATNFGFAFNVRAFTSAGIVFLVLIGCSSKPKSPDSAASSPSLQSATAPTSSPLKLETVDANPAQKTTVLALPKDFGRYTGDWDQIVKRGYLRVLVVNSKSGFFYDRGRPRGAIAEYMEEFENVINKKLKTGAKKFKVVYLPMTPGQLPEALNGGIGDIACTAIIITPEREQLFDFTVPVWSDTKLVVVTSKDAPSITSIEDLSGKDVYVNPITVANAELERLNQRFKQTGKQEIGIKQIDSNLSEEDLLEMVERRADTHDRIIERPRSALVQGFS